MISKTAVALALVLAVSGSASSAYAEECPDNVPAASRERRALAKEFFSRAEAADSGGDPIGAVRAYQCSLKMVPHAFTAFNLGRLAERTGDLELAVEAFGAYVKLAPESPDRTEIEGKIVALGERIQTLRKEHEAASAPVATPVVPRPAPASEPPIDLKPAPSSEPALVERAPAPSSGGAMKVVPWVVAGAGVAALATGIVLNVSARGKMSDCRSLAAAGKLDDSNSACDAAKPRAYTSYALFGVAAAAAIADGILLLMSDDKKSSSVSAAPLGDGAMVTGRLRF